jgi:esterase/lipase superfamily enzyme
MPGKKQTTRRRSNRSNTRTYTLYYATNRAHTGRDRWRPSGYGPDFSQDGAENLRFGKITLDANPDQVSRHRRRAVGFGVGDGNGLAEYFSRQARRMRIEAFEESLDPAVLDTQQQPKLGSARTFSELQQCMLESRDVLIFIHGFNVSWRDAVTSALSLQEMLNPADGGTGGKDVLVFLFTWPSDGLALPYVSYKSDRTDAEATGYAFGRGLLKLRDFIAALRSRDASGEILCGQELHLLCHSMGNFVLQNTLDRMSKYNEGSMLPRMFEHIFMCAPDVDDDVFEPGKALVRLPELARSISVYHNKGDTAMYVSDYTKGNPERLGLAGAAKPALLHNKIHQIDCSPIVRGLIEHSYFIAGRVNQDIRLSLQGLTHDDPTRHRDLAGGSWPNVWRMT